MNRLAATLVLLVLVAPAAAQSEKAPPPPARYGVAPRLEAYPQGTPKETLASVLSAVENRRIDYLLAHLTDPAFVDERVQKFYAGDFDGLVRETTAKLNDNPEAIKELRRFLKEGEWEGDDKTASAKVKDIKDRQVFFRKIGARWFLENRQRAEK